ncbi:tetratricopeptide repeat protein [Ruegeria sp.]|uniref:tetratricopeptide repeat protein n=1 Tax=Ruegeria sp. TaxID=1879320 RepID=UPI00231BD1D9|nr:tetratricopeptide repeat protein [Ruegeria sp.]MDA7966828.1 tetratricopeptide repeat protein [Ruegeria sp.]
MASVLLETAIEKLQRNDPAGAQRVLDKLSVHDQGRAEVLLLRGLSELAQSDAAKALEYLSRAHDLKPDEPVILQNLINAGLAIADGAPAQDAIVQYERVLELDNGNEQALLGLARCRQECCDFEDAVELYHVYLTLHPQDVSVLIGLGYCLQELRRPDEARVAYEKALTIDSKVRPLVLKSLSTASSGSVSLTGYRQQDMLTF